MNCVAKKNYRELVSNKRDLITSMGMVFALIISYPGFDINIPIDDDNNTPIMFFLMTKDIVAINFILSYCDNVDLRIKNKNGINASILALNIKNEIIIMQHLIKHKTFDTQFIDQYNNNILTYSILFDNPYAYTAIVNEHPKTLEHVNNKKENSIIIATKLGFLEKIKGYTIRNANFNQQDELGNTALFYAVNMRSIYDINLLAYYHANLNIKNNQGLTPMDQAVQIGEEKLIKYMEKPKPVHEMKEDLEKSKGLFKSKNSSFDKTDDYIKNYQINNFKENYKKILDDCNTYSYIENNRDVDIDSQFVFVIYVMLNRLPVYSMTNVNPLDAMFDKRLRRYANRRCLGYDNDINEVLLMSRLTSIPLEEFIDLDDLFSYGEPTVNYSFSPKHVNLLNINSSEIFEGIKTNPYLFDN